MFYKTSWTAGTLSAGTTGIIATSLSPSIASSSEYSGLQTFFNEVKIVSATLLFTTIQSTASGPKQGRIMIGTNMLANYTTFTTPTSYVSVQNLARKVTISSSEIKPVRYRFLVPKNLEYSSLTADAPSTPTPWAGTPGAVYIYGDGFTNSDAYYTVDWENVIFHLRGRQ